VEAQKNVDLPVLGFPTMPTIKAKTNESLPLRFEKPYDLQATALAILHNWSVEQGP
jgi:hypothetical protein